MLKLTRFSLRHRGARLGSVAPATVAGHVIRVSPLSVEISGLGPVLAVGERVVLQPGQGPPMDAEIVAAERGRLAASPFGTTAGLRAGAMALSPLPRPGRVRGALLAPSAEWLGRVIDPLGRALDDKGPLVAGARPRAVRAPPPPAASRARLGARLDLGVRALNCFATCRVGQRLGLFAGSGVGKSTLLAMLARGAAADVTVLALVGERGREVRDFLEDTLGDDGMENAIAVVATSDAPPLMRREAAYAAMTVAEHFRDEGRSVLLLMDSVTRFCLALREIALAAGEPPATRGYPASVFAELPLLLERAGPGPARQNRAAGQITALFTVLVEGDDHDEPVADAVRGILDGHVVLDRRIGEGGRYPAIDVLRSLSRTASGCLTRDEAEAVRRARAILALHADMADMIRLGAYKAGSDPAVDAAIRLAPQLEAMLQQAPDESATIGDSFLALQAALRDA